MTAAGKDYASMTKSLTTDMLNGVNKTLVDLITTRGSHRGVWSALGSDLAKKTAAYSIQAGESGIMGSISAITGGRSAPAGMGDGGNALSKVEGCVKAVVRFCVKPVFGLPVPVRF
jgi:phage-related minor tail protein